MMVAKATEAMIHYFKEDMHRITHFLKVWAYARNIGQAEGLDPYTLETLELTAVVHDIACPLCYEKYGNASGPNQEKEGPALARAFYEPMGLPEEQLERICYLVGHHHTVTDVDGLDYRIMLEADFLVNADEMDHSRESILAFRDKVFRTETGIRLINSIYGLE